MGRSRVSGSIKKYVRITGTRQGRFVEFEFSIKDSDLTVELILPLRAFEEFCALQDAIILAPADLYGRAEFEALCARCRNFRYAPALSHEPEAGVWADERGFAHEVAKRLFAGAFEGITAYLCGLPPMIEACIATLMQGCLFEKHISTEKFFAVANTATKPRSPVFKRL